MQGDGDGDGTLSSQGGHCTLCLCFVARGFDPGAAQVGQLVELDAVLLQVSGAGWCWTCWCLCGHTETLFFFLMKSLGVLYIFSPFISVANFKSISRVANYFIMKCEISVNNNTPMFFCVMMTGSTTGLSPILLLTSCSITTLQERKKDTVAEWQRTSGTFTSQTGSRTMRVAAELPLLTCTFDTTLTVSSEFPPSTDDVT